MTLSGISLLKEFKNTKLNDSNKTTKINKKY